MSDNGVPVRVAFLDHTAALGGGEIALLRLLEVIDRKRIDPVVVLFADGPLVPLLKEAGVECHILPLSASVIQARKDSLGVGSILKLGAVWQAVTFVYRLCALLGRLNVRLIHTNSLKSDLIGGVAARLIRKPVVWHVRDRIVPEYLPGTVVRVFRVLCRYLPSRVVTNSHATLLTLFKDPPTDPSEVLSKYIVVHDGTTLPTCPSTSDPSRPLIGLVGRITKWKGQDVFLRAISKIRHQFPSARFQIIGSALFQESEYDAHVRKLCHDLQLDDCVEFTGFRSDVRELIGQLTILVHASTTGEPFGQVVIEAMSAGKPLIATNGGGIPEIVENTHTGMLVPMNDATAMANSIAYLLNNPDIAAEMGRRGRQRVIDKFMVNHTARRLERVFAGMMHTRNRFDLAPAESPA